MKLTKFIAIVLLTGAAVLAQGPAPGGGGFGRGMARRAFAMRGRKVVTGAPYTADMSSTRTQTLADGNVIQNTVTGKVARDGDGRTYSMETSTGGPLGQNGPVTRISIFDPVAGYSYELNATTKTGTRRAIHVPPAGSSSSASEATKPANPNVVKASLGTQTVNGVAAEGTSRTRTIPAGAMGNAKPIVSTSETWYSAELQTVISAKFTDPRAGQLNFALTNIQTTADPTLFQVPAGYTVTDAAPGAGRRGLRGQFRHAGAPPPQE